jgi:hypothetical protein
MRQGQQSSLGKGARRAAEIAPPSQKALAAWAVSHALLRRMVQKSTAAKRATSVLALTGKNGPAQKDGLRKKGARGKSNEASCRPAPHLEPPAGECSVSSVVGGKPRLRAMSQDGTGGQGPLQRVAVGRRILMRLAMRAGYGDRVAGSHPAPLPQRGGRSRPQWDRSFPLTESGMLGGVRRSANPAPQALHPQRAQNRADSGLARNGTNKR